MMVTLSAGGSGEAPSPSGNSFNATARMVAKGTHPLTTRRRRVGKGSISSAYGGGGYKPATTGVDNNNSVRQSAGDPLKGGPETINTTTMAGGAPAGQPSSSSTQHQQQQQQQQSSSNQPQHNTTTENSSSSTTTPAKPCHNARMSALCCQNAIRMGARAQLGLCPPGRPRRSLQAALRQRTRSSTSNSTQSSSAASRRLAAAAATTTTTTTTTTSATDPNGYYAIEKMIGTQSLEDYEDQEEDYLLSTNTFDVESDEEASSGDEDDLSTIEALLAPDNLYSSNSSQAAAAQQLAEDQSKYLNLREPLFTPIGVEGSLSNPNGAPMASGMGSGASGKLPFNRRKIRYFDTITAQDRQAARAYLTSEADKARRRSAILLKRHLRRMQKEERRKRRIQKGEPVGPNDTEPEAVDPKEAELIDGGVAQFEQPMTAAMSAALILESLSFNPLESVEGMAKCYDGIVAAGVALLESIADPVSSPTEPGDENEKPRTSRADVLAALAPLLITSLEQPSGDVILLLARMRRMCGTPRYQRRFVQRVAPCLVRPKNAAIWCLRHQHDMEPIVAATELILDSAHTIFSKGWYEKGQLYLADSKRAETLNSAAAQLRNLSGEPSEGLSLGLASTHGHGIRRYTSTASHKDQKGSRDQLAEWEVMAVDKEIRLSISKIMSSDWTRVNLTSAKDSDSVRSFRRATSTGKRPSVLPQSSSGEASPRASMLSPRSPSRPMGIKTPLSPPPPKDFSAPIVPPQSDPFLENIVPTPPAPADRPTSPDNALVQKSGNGMVLSPPPAHRHGADEIESKTALITSSTPPRSPKSPMREAVEQAPPLSKLSANAPTPFTPISPRRSRALSPPSSQNIRDSSAGNENAMTPFTPSLGTSAVAPLSPSSTGTGSTSDLVSYRPSSSVGSVVSSGPGASQAAHYRTLTSTASERKRTVAACRALRAQITRFEDAFIQLHGRPPKGAAERAPLATTYSQYREWKRAIRADAACRIQALFRGARTRWILMRSGDTRITAIVRGRAGRRQYARPDMEQAPVPRQPTNEPRLFLPNEIGEPPEQNRGTGLRPSLGSSVGSSNAQSPTDDPFAGQPAGPVLTPPQWANQVVRRRHEQQQRTPDGFPVVAAPPSRSSPLPSPSPNPGSEIGALSLSELQAKKRELKQQLKQYDMNFARKNGRMPVKAEKEPIRHLYENYNALKSQIALLEQEGGRQMQSPVQQLQVNAVPPPSRMMAAPPTPPDSSDSDRSIDSPGMIVTSRGKRKQLKSPPIATSSTPPGPPSQDLQALKAEKGQLHQMLRSYEKDFFKEHKRQVSSFADIKPVASQYRRYKEIKKAITALQGASER